MEASSPHASLSPGSPAGRTSSRGSAFDRASLDRGCEWIILGLVLAILIFGPIAFGAVGVPQILVIQSLTLGLLLTWVARVWLSKSYRLLWPPVCWAVAAFLIYAGFRYRMVLTDQGVEYLARQEVLLVGVYGILFFAILNNLSRQDPIQIISLTLLGVGALISMYAVYQFLTKSGRVLWSPQYPGYLGRGSGTFMCPNHLAGFLEMVLPLGLAYTLTGRFKPTAKVFLGYASLAVFAGIAVTVSRGGWIATGLGVLVFFGLLMRHRGQRLAGIIFLILLIGASVFFVKNLSVLERRIRVTRGEQRADASRTELWTSARQMWQDNLWWGVGPAHFDQRFRSYRPDDIQMRPLYAHNDYLNTLADWGLTGMGLISATLALLAVGVVQSWKFVQRSNDLTTKRSNRSAFVLGAVAGLAALLAHSVVDFNMHIPANAIVAVTLMAVMTGHLRFATERYWLKLGWIGKFLLTGVALAAAFYLGSETLRRAREYVLLERASRATDFQVRMGLLNAAHAADPKNFETTYEIGESLRLASWQPVENYKELATAAVPWFERGTKLNQFDPYNYLGLGMCMHWLDRPDEAGPYFQKAITLDPKNYYIQGHVGWHYFQLAEWVESKRWFEKAIYNANWHPDPKFKRYETGIFYTNLIQQKLTERLAKP